MLSTNYSNYLMSKNKFSNRDTKTNTISNPNNNLSTQANFNDFHILF